jgi:hypothetical protein
MEDRYILETRCEIAPDCDPFTKPINGLLRTHITGFIATMQPSSDRISGTKPNVSIARSLMALNTCNELH